MRLGVSLTFNLLDPDSLVYFYSKFKDHPPDAVKQIAFERGLEFGRMLSQQMNIKGKDVSAIAEILNAILKDEPMYELTIIDNKVRIRNEGFCPLMHVATSLDIPWDWLCGNLGWPFFHGLGAAVDPDVKLNIVKWRKKGDPYCDHIYEIK